MNTESEASFHVIRTLKPIAPVAPGQVYEFLDSVITRGDIVHKRGELLHVVDKTTSCPHGEIGEGDRNWVCRTDHGTSVWATLEQCISRDLLRPVRLYHTYFWYGDLKIHNPRDGRGRLLTHPSSVPLPFTPDDIEELSHRFDVMVSTATQPAMLYLSPIGSKFGQR